MLCLEQNGRYFEFPFLSFIFTLITYHFVAVTSDICQINQQNMVQNMLWLQIANIRKNVPN
jgi:hypothetical protein